MANATIADVQDGLWVVADDTCEETVELTLALVSEASKLASKLGAVSILAAGQGAVSLASRAGHYGAEKAIVIGPNKAANPSPRAFARSLENLLRKRAPRLVLFPSTRKSNEIATLTAAYVSCPLLTGGIWLNIDDQGRVLVTKPSHNGKIHKTFEGSLDLPLLVTLKTDGMVLSGIDGSRHVATTEELCDLTGNDNEAIEIVDVIDEKPGTENISDAQVVVGCGRGLGHRDNLRLLEQLAEMLGGTVGGTRAAVDAGWIPLSRQIGQTGKTIAPRLYIACGISGATHHVAGVQNARLIVAINKDRDAPMLKVADIAVVGDLLEIVPEVIAVIGNSRLASNNRIQA